MKSFRYIALSLFATLALLSASADTIAQEQVSDAEKRVFMTDHLKSVTGPATLSYEFTKSGTLEKGFQDKVTLSVKAPANGPGKNCHIDFLAGERQFKGVPDLIENATGNPIILAFLERDLGEMKRITKGQPNYYRKRIRMNLAEKAEIRPVTIKHEGKELAGFDVLLNPFVDDPARSRYEKYSNKTYAITLSEQIPGGLYKMYSIMRERAADAATAKPMIEETLTYIGIKK